QHYDTVKTSQYSLNENIYQHEYKEELNNHINHTNISNNKNNENSIIKTNTYEVMIYESVINPTTNEVNYHVIQELFLFPVSLTHTFESLFDEIYKNNEHYLQNNNMNNISLSKYNLNNLQCQISCSHFNQVCNIAQLNLNLHEISKRY